MNGYKNPNGRNSNLNNLKQANDSRNSFIFYALSCFIILFFIWAPFQKALFNGNSFDFERPIYSALLWSFLALFLLSLQMFNQWRGKYLSDLMAVFIWLIPLTYVISLTSAGSVTYASNMILIQSMYTSFFLIGLYISKNNKGIELLGNVLVLTGYIIVQFGMFNWFGNKEWIFIWVKWFASSMNNASFYQDAVFIDPNGVRLTSVFQYANSYSAFLIALLLAAFYLIVSSKKTVSLAFHSFMAVPIIISFFLTLSRGGLVILPVVLLFVLPFLKPFRQIVYIVQLGVSFALSLLVLNKLTEIGIQLSKEFDRSLSLNGWLILLGVSALNALIAIIIQKYVSSWLKAKLEGITKFRFANITLPVVVIITGMLGVILLFNTGIINLLPENVKTRIENINFQQHSVLERGTFYKDAMKLFADHPITGAGGGAWSAMYEKYQNNPYVSRQAHNFFLQYLVETGILGMAVFLIFFVMAFWIFVRSYRNREENQRRLVFYCFVIALLIHSMIDFDLSYVYLGILVFLSLGAMVSGDKTELKGRFVAMVGKYRWIYPSVILLASVILFFQSTQLLKANSNFTNAQALTQAQKPINEIFGSLDKAINTSPGHPDYAGFKIDILLQAYNQSKNESFYNDAVKLIESTREREPYNRMLVERQLNTYFIKNQLEQALELVNHELNSFPWDISLYERSISINFDLGNKALQENKKDISDKYWKQAMDTYALVQEKVKALDLLPKEQQQGRRFAVTRNMGIALGQLEFIRGNYVEAEQHLSTGLNDQFTEPLDRQQGRWYLAALQKQGKGNQPLMDKLIAKDPTEKDQIAALVSTKF
jgi:tetratricopeptide (TPR) repeat protein